MSKKPDRFMLASAGKIDDKLKELGPGFADRYIVTSAMAWDTKEDKPCLMFSVLVTNDEGADVKDAWAQIMYLDDVTWVPADQVAQLSRQGVEEHLISKPFQKGDEV